MFHSVYGHNVLSTKRRGVGSGETSSEEEFKAQRCWRTVPLPPVLDHSSALRALLFGYFPFQRFGTNMLQCNLGISAETAADLLRWFPIGALMLTPPLGYCLDKFGRGATMLILGSLLLIGCHLVFALLLPAVPSQALALVTILVLGCRSHWCPLLCGLQCPR